MNVPLGAELGRVNTWRDVINNAFPQNDSKIFTNHPLVT